MSQQTINTPRDTTLQATNTALGLIAKDASLLATNTALGLLAKDDTLDDVVTNLSTIITKLQAIATALTPSIANDYDELVDKPQINGVTLSGNKTAKQLGIRQTIPMNSAAYALLSSAEKMDPDKDYIITDANAVNVPIDDSDISVNKVWSSKKTDDTKADKEAILQTVEECEASTDPDDIAGAAAVSALNSNITTLSNRVDANTRGTAVSILSYTSSSNTYTFPNDGYVTVKSGDTQGDFCTARVAGLIDISAKTQTTNYNEYNALFVKKGMKVYILAKSGSTTTANYYPITSGS